MQYQGYARWAILAIQNIHKQFNSAPLFGRLTGLRYVGVFHRLLWPANILKFELKMQKLVICFTKFKTSNIIAHNHFKRKNNWLHFYAADFQKINWLHFFTKIISHWYLYHFLLCNLFKTVLISTNLMRCWLLINFNFSSFWWLLQTFFSFVLML